MANSLKKIQAGADKARQKLANAGFREFSLTLRTLSGGSKDPILDGQAVGAASTDVVVSPPPRVEQVSVKLVASSSGVILMGDLRVSKLSRLPAYEALVNDPKTVWVIGGPGNLAGLYSSVGGSIERKDTEWVVVLRRVLA